MVEEGDSPISVTNCAANLWTVLDCGPCARRSSLPSTELGVTRTPSTQRTMTAAKRQRIALVQYPPSQLFVLESLLPALQQELPTWRIVTRRSDLAAGEVPDLQWGDYDELDWDEAMQPGRMCNSYLIRKGCACRLTAR